MQIKREEYFDSFNEEALSSFFEQITIEINGFGLYESTNKKIISHSPNDLEILYYKEGEANITIGTRKYHCSKQSIVVLEPYGLNTISNQAKEKYSYYYIHFEIKPLYLQNQLLSLLTKHGHVIYKEEFRDFSEMFGRLLLESKEKEMGYRTIITSGLMRVLVEIIRAQHKRKEDFQIERVSRQYINIVDEALKYINSHISEAIKLEVMAKEIGVSPSYLYKVFYKVMDIAPSQYILKYKISKAQKLLIANYQIKDIASRLGFSSAYHFSKVFKQQMQMSPKQYQIHINKHMK